MLKLKFQYFGHLMYTDSSLEKLPMLGKIEGRRRRRHQSMMRWLDGISDAMDKNLGKLKQMVRNREAWRAAVRGSQEVEYDWVTEQQMYASFCCFTSLTAPFSGVSVFSTFFFFLPATLAVICSLHSKMMTFLSTSLRK